MQIAESATKIRAWFVETSGYYTLEYNVGDMLKSWTHVALVSVSKSSKLFHNTSGDALFPCNHCYRLDRCERLL